MQQQNLVKQSQNYQFLQTNIFTNKMLAAFHRPVRSTRSIRHTRVGPYRYLPKDLLGEGFSSKVYKGLNMHEEQVAIKIINPAILQEEINAILLESELEMLQLMKGCDHILELHSIIHEGRYTYIVTEVCKTDVSKILVPLLPLDTTEKYIWQLLQGYKQIFLKQVIHRDLKPANLLIDHHGRLKIADFGFAIKASEVGTQSDFNIGSPLYMAPEALKKNDYSYKSDIWAIGIIVYELLTGDTPWKADNEQELYRKLKEVKIERILKNTSFPDYISELLLKTLQFDKKARITPEELILFETKIKSRREQTQVPPAADESRQQPSRPNFYIPRTGKNTKTEKFYKPSTNNYSGYTVKPKETMDEPIAVNIKGSYRPEPTERLEQRLEQDETIFLAVSKEGTNSTAKTKGSSTMAASEDSLPALTKQEAKSITDKLVYYVHICRLYFKMLGRLDACIEKNFNANAVAGLAARRDEFFMESCRVMVAYLYRVKNLAVNNFLSLPQSHLESYISSSEYKKLKKICVDYIDKYSGSDSLKELWRHADDPDFGNLAHLSAGIIEEIWKEICQRNSDEIILLQFLIFSWGVVQGLRAGQLDSIDDKERIEDFVDTIPNPPTYDRFREVVKNAKRIIQEHKRSQTEPGN